MSRKIAILSNINMNYVSRLLQKDCEVLIPEGYANELGQMMNPDSAYNREAPEVTVLVLDLMELLQHEWEDAAAKIGQWFQTLEGCLKKDRFYFVSDTRLMGPELSVLPDDSQKIRVEGMWQEALKKLCEAYPNVYTLPMGRILDAEGQKASVSYKTWYLGKILYTGEVQKEIAQLICGRICLLDRVPKKVLLLDLDNTLWGGLAGETDHKPVELSEDHEGLAYKNLQRVILQMAKQGVLLGIVSKNNEEDAMEILKNHPHCLLRPEVFAIRKINWKPKQENILEIARELNLGLDSFVFWDDSPVERELVKSLLPQVCVPDFPAKPEELAFSMAEIYREYFEKLKITKEDLSKTRQYQENARRASLKAAVGFEEYLKQLKMVLIPRDPKQNVERMVQLFNKTNQFNLTTKRYQMTQAAEELEDPAKRFFLYQVKDCFGDNGIVAAVVADLSGEVPQIEEFVMSCRVMGRNLEYAIMEEVENRLKAEGFRKLRGNYIPSAKNKPVEELYDRLGYQILKKNENQEKEYEIDLAKRPKRVYYTAIEKE